jgi:uncharacterized membrane protein YoaK (UPF0700 family)
MILAAAGTVPAVVSGLVLSRGVVLGHADLRMHHLFVWPVFALVAALGTWRILGRGGSALPIPAVYLAAVGLATALMLAAGYWGGEMVLR